MKPIRVIYNTTHFRDDNGNTDADWDEYQIGRNKVESIQPNFPHTGQCRVHFKDGTATDIYNVNQVYYEAETKQTEQ